MRYAILRRVTLVIFVGLVTLVKFLGRVVWCCLDSLLSIP